MNKKKSEILSEEMDKTIQKLCNEFEIDVKGDKFVYRQIKMSGTVGAPCFEFADQATLGMLPEGIQYLYPVVKNNILYVFKGVKGKLRPLLLIQSSSFTIMYNVDAFGSDYDIDDDGNEDETTTSKIVNFNPQC